MIRMCIRRRGVQRIVTRGTDDVPQITDERPALLCDPDAVRQIAHALQDVTTFYEMPEDPDDVVEWVLNFGRLILVDRSPREVFWDRVAVAPEAWDQSGVQWDLLWTLANNPGQIVHQGLLRNPDGQRIASRRNRLSTLLTDCQELDQRIVNVHGQGYRLEMNAENIILLREDMRGSLAFVGSHHLASR